MEELKSKFDEELIPYLITARTVSEPIEPLITLDESIFSIKGGLSLVTGMPKGGKTTALKIMIETAFMEQIKDGYDNIGIRSTYKPDKSLIYVNTEMTDADMTKFRDSICRALQVEHLPENLYIFHLLTPNPKKRLQLLEKAVQQSEDAFLVLIDGLADLVSSVNEEKECNDAIQRLQNLAVNSGVGIIGVIHENRGNKQTRGHLGQQAERKCVGAISVAKNREKKLFEITATMTRHTDDFEKIIYHYNEKGRLERLDKSSPKLQTYSSQTEYVEFAKNIFGEDKELSDKDIKARIRKHYKDSEPNLLPQALYNRLVRRMEVLVHSNIIGDLGESKWKLMTYIEVPETV